MRKRRLFLLALLTLGLTSCSLFNDDDIKIVNNYNPPVEHHTPGEHGEPVAGGVEGKDVVVKDDDGNVIKTIDALVYKSICYATDNKITNTYKVGQVNHDSISIREDYHINNDQDYEGSVSRNNYDLYIPNSFKEDPSKMNQNHIVVLFIHGGAWITGFKTDVNEYLYEFAERGYIAATIKYSLLKKDMDDSSLSIFRDLDEIDACIASIKQVLGELGFDTNKTKLVLGGASSGAHLAMLYTYSRGQLAPIIPQLLINAVGPVEIKPSTWKKFKAATEAQDVENGIRAGQINESHLEELPVAGMGYYWNNYQTMRIANGMCGIPYSLQDVEEAATDESKTEVDTTKPVAQSMLGSNGGEDILSVTYWLNKSSVKTPMICAYAGKDTVVGVNQFSKLEAGLIAKSYVYESDYWFYYFKNSDHENIDDKKPDRVETYNNFLGKITEKCNSLL